MTSDGHLHLETDGKLFLVDVNGQGPVLPVPGRPAGGEHAWLIRHPTATEVTAAGLTWEVVRTNRFRLGGEAITVIHAHPHTETWPGHWAWKDAVISDSLAHPVVREAVHRSLPRVVAKTIVRNAAGEVLMVRTSRGFFQGMWTLSGGYVDYGEHPRTGAMRELWEELGLRAEVSDPWGEVSPAGWSGGVPDAAAQAAGWSHVMERTFTGEGLQYLSFTYHTSVGESPALDLRADEIAEARWFSPEAALEQAASLFDVEALRRLRAAELAGLPPAARA